MHRCSIVLIFHHVKVRIGESISSVIGFYDSRQLVRIDMYLVAGGQITGLIVSPDASRWLGANGTEQLVKIVNLDLTILERVAGRKLIEFGPEKPAQHAMFSVTDIGK